MNRTSPSRGEVKRCTRCLKAGYCSKKCQTKAWKAYHKRECERLGHEQFYSPNVRKVVRSLLVATNMEEEEAFDDKKFPLSVKQLSFDTDRATEVRCGMGPIPMIVSPLGFTLDDMSTMFAICDKNYFGLYWEGEMLPYGVGLCQRASLFNHHCQPNCRRTSHGRYVEIRSVRDLKKGEEVYIPYTVSKLATTEERQRLIKKDHGFICKCSLCEDPNSDLVLRCITCPTEKCKGFLKMVSGTEAKCTVCGHILHDSDDRWVEMTEEEIEMKWLILTEEKVGMRRKLLNIFGDEVIPPRVIHPNHYLVVEARNALMWTLLSQKENETAVKLARANLGPLRYQHSLYDRGLLRVYMTLGNECSHGDIGERKSDSPLEDMQRGLGNVECALEMYSKIREIIQITHDENNPLHQVVNTRIRGLTKNVASTKSLIRMLMND